MSAHESQPVFHDRRRKRHDRAHDFLSVLDFGSAAEKTTAGKQMLMTGPARQPAVRSV